MASTVAPRTSTTVIATGDLVAITLAAAPDGFTAALTIAQCSLLRADLLVAMQEAEAFAHG